MDLVMVVLERLLGLLEKYYSEFVAALRDYEEGRECVYAVERLAQLIAQTILGSAAVLAVREDKEKPGTYREVAAWLSRRLGLGKDLEEYLAGLAGFRNILVHLYAEIREDLEHEAFLEIAEKTPRLITRLREVARGDPCLDEVRDKLREAGREIGARYILVFGSLARRGCGHDVDVAVKLGRRPRSTLELGRIQAILEDTLRAPVDLVVADVLEDPGLAATIAREAVLVYGDPEEAELYRAKLLSIYLDYVEQAKKLKRLRSRAYSPLGARGA
jgi:uncharacterized protein YutE (UPF0331/DUF86 family)/predicted nucleotidyltransferase